MILHTAQLDLIYGPDDDLYRCWCRKILAEALEIVCRIVRLDDVQSWAVVRGTEK